MWTPWLVRIIAISDHTCLWKRRLIPGTNTCRMMHSVPHAGATAGSPPPGLLSNTRGRQGEQTSPGAHSLSLAKLLRPSLPSITRRNKCMVKRPTALAPFPRSSPVPPCYREPSSHYAFFYFIFGIWTSLIAKNFANFGGCDFKFAVRLPAARVEMRRW